MTFIEFWYGGNGDYVGDRIGYGGYGGDSQFTLLPEC